MEKKLSEATKSNLSEAICTYNAISLLVNLISYSFLFDSPQKTSLSSQEIKGSFNGNFFGAVNSLNP
ncbi:hypothetical protein ES705_26363 [subsurface metagenome]